VAPTSVEAQQALGGVGEVVVFGEAGLGVMFFRFSDRGDFSLHDRFVGKPFVVEQQQLKSWLNCF
jgi:hypothetical protein